MNKQKGTISILESIRNKLKKIEKNHTSITNDQGNQDDFEYIDNSSKELITSKQKAKIATGAENHQIQSHISKNIDDDFDFLNGTDTDTVVQKTSPTLSINITTQNTEASKPESQQPPLEPPIYQGLKTPESAFTNNDLDLDLNFEAESKEFIALETNPYQEIAVSTVEEKNDLERHNQANISEKDTENNLAEDLDLDLDLDLEEETDLTLSKDNNESLNDDLDDLTDNTEANSENHEEVVENDDLDNDLEDLNENDTEEEQENQEEDLDDLETLENMENLEDNDLEEYEEIKETIPMEPINTTLSNNTDNMNEKTSFISETAAKKATNSIKDLMRAIPKKQHFLQNPSPAFRSGETIEDMISTMLAPKLEQWMEENLPIMVEKIVRDEIKKLIPKDE